MREQRNYIICAVATANGFAMPYRARPASQADKDERAGKDSATAARGKLRLIHGPRGADRDNAKS